MRTSSNPLVAAIMIESLSETLGSQHGGLYDSDKCVIARSASSTPLILCRFGFQGIEPNGVMNSACSSR